MNCPTLIVHCAFRRTPDGLMFMPESGTPDSHPMWCELQASLYLQDAEETRPVICAIEMRSYGRDYAVDCISRGDLRDLNWRHLDAEVFEAASGFLAMNYASEMRDCAETLMLEDAA